MLSNTIFILLERVMRRTCPFMELVHAERCQDRFSTGTNVALADDGPKLGRTETIGFPFSVGRCKSQRLNIRDGLVKI